MAIHQLEDRPAGEPDRVRLNRARHRPPARFDDPPRRLDRDGGAGLFATSASVLVFLVFLLFTVQILIGLYGRSVVTSAAYDGARAVAGARVDHGDPNAVARAQATAVDRMRQQLGDVGSRATFDWNGTDADTVVLRIQADNPRFAFPGFSGPLVTDHIDRTVRARVERFR